MNDEYDRALRELFARLRAEERGDVPSFQAIRARATRHDTPRWTRVSVAAAIAAAVVLFALTLVRPDQPQLETAIIDVEFWRSPTDFLLSTPGSELMSAVPLVGVPRDWTPIGTPGPAPAPESTRS